MIMRDEVLAQPEHSIHTLKKESGRSIWVLRAKKITKKGEYEEARKLYTTILEASPNNQEA